MGEHHDGTFVACLVRVTMNQMMQRGARRHRVEQQNQTGQQRGEHRFAVMDMSSPVFHLKALTRFKLPDNDGHCKSRDQRRRQFKPVVRVKLEFRQEIAAGDAEE